MRQCIVVIAGPPGAGKSTQIRNMAFELRNKGKKVKTTNLASGHVLTYLWPLANILAKLLTRRRSEVSPNMVILEDNPYVFRRLFKLWITLDTLSVCAKFLFEIYLPSRLGYCVIVEQSTPTIIADYFYLCRLLRLPTKTTSRCTGLLQRLIHLAQPTRVVFLDAETRVLESRWRRRAGLHMAETPEYVSMQRTSGLSLLRTLHTCDLVYVDSTWREILTTREVREALSDILGEPQT